MQDNVGRVTGLRRKAPGQQILGLLRRRVAGAEAVAEPAAESLGGADDRDDGQDPDDHHQPAVVVAPSRPGGPVPGWKRCERAPPH